MCTHAKSYVRVHAHRRPAKLAYFKLISIYFCLSSKSVCLYICLCAADAQSSVNLSAVSSEPFLPFQGVSTLQIKAAD